MDCLVEYVPYPIDENTILPFLSIQKSFGVLTKVH